MRERESKGSRSHRGGGSVLIGLADRLVSDALSRLLSEAGFDPIGCRCDLDALVAKAAQRRPDMVLVGPQVMIDDGSSRCLDGMREAVPGIRIVLMLRDLDGSHTRALIRYSVNGVIPLAAQSSEAIGILRQVMDGNVVYPSAILGHLARNAEPEILSERQREVLAQVALGRSNDEIAKRLFISRNTVKFHVREIYARLGVHNRVEAARIAPRALGGAPRTTRAIDAA